LGATATPSALPPGEGGAALGAAAGAGSDVAANFGSGGAAAAGGALLTGAALFLYTRRLAARARAAAPAARGALGGTLSRRIARTGGGVGSPNFNRDNPLRAVRPSPPPGSPPKWAFAR